jgi:hypothetical protein
MNSGRLEMSSALDRQLDEALNQTPLKGRAHVLPILFNFLKPLHVMAEIGGLLVILRCFPIRGDKRDERYAEWSLDLLGARGRQVILQWTSAGGGITRA